MSTLILSARPRAGLTAGATFAFLGRVDPALYDMFYEIERTHWWSVGMRRIFHGLLAPALRNVDHPRLMDVGCGTGISVAEFGCLGSITGFDAAWQAVSHTKRRTPTSHVCQADILHLPVASGAIDAVLALDVIEHIEDDRSALREIRRVLRTDGLVLINVPAFPSLWSEKDTVNHHVRRYTKPGLRMVLEQTGFGVVRLTYTNAVLFTPIWLARQIQRRARLHWNSQGEYRLRPRVNAALERLLRWEASALRHVRPFGTSVTCLARARP